MTAAASENAPDERLFGAGGVTPGWRVVMASMLTLAFGPSVVLLMCFGVFAPSLNEAFGWDIGAISLGATIMALTVMVLSPVQGVLVDRFGARRMVLISLPLFALGVAGFSFLTSDIRGFYLACLIVPILGVGAWPLSYLKLTSTWFNRRLGLALGFANVGVGIGAALLPVFIGIALTYGGWRAAYLALAAAILIFVWPLAAIFLRENELVSRGGRNAAARTALGLTLPEIFRTSSFWLLMAAFLVLGIISSGILIHQVGILIDHGLSRGEAIGLQSVLGAASIVGRIAAGWLLDRVRLSWVMAVVLVAAAGAALIYASSATGIALVLAAAIFGFVLGAEFDALGFGIRRYFGLRAFGVVFGLIFAAFQLGASAGVVAIGKSRDASGSYAIGMFTLAGLSIGAAAIFLLLRSYRYEGDGRLAAEASNTTVLVPKEVLPS